MFVELFLRIYLVFFIFHFTIISDSSSMGKIYKKCRASWSKWMISKTSLHWNITDINLNITGRKCAWINTSCTRNRRCPCETYYSKELLGVRLPRKKSHVCVQTKSCRVLICSSIVHLGSNIDSNKLAIKTYKVENRTDESRNLIGLVYVPLDHGTWKSYEADKIQVEEVSEEVKSDSYVYLDVLQTPISPVRGKSYSPPSDNNNDYYDDKNGHSPIFIGSLLFSLLCLFLFVSYFVKMCYTSSCTNIWSMKYHSTKANILIDETQAESDRYNC